MSCRSTTRTSTTTMPPRRRRAAPRRRDADAALVVTPGVQRQHSRGAEERHRLAVTAIRQRRAEGQAAGCRRRRIGPVRRGVGARRDPQVVRDRRSRVVEDLKLSVPFKSLDGKHPRENAEVAANLRDMSASWPPRSADSQLDEKPPEGSDETRRRLCCYVTVTIRPRLLSVPGGKHDRWARHTLNVTSTRRRSTADELTTREFHKCCSEHVVSLLNVGH